ncbi:MAG TPA: hypothetical protein VFK57_19890 [Vicinamibacterales bacterium]|nr:hypothetical protein [Vicinamibacterales bacterium]
MSIREVPPDGWRSFLERFSGEHRGWRATIHGVERGFAVTRVPSEAIKAITLERHGPYAMMRLTFLNGVSLCAPGARALRVQQTVDGADRALEIELNDGAFIRVAFRAAARPEQVDGIAPAELADEVWVLL